MKLVFPDDLLPGDILIYTGTGIFDRLISFCTRSKADHIEAYAGNRMSVASRNGIGVNIYPFRREGLLAVIRPVQPFDFASAMRTFYAKQKGKVPYGWSDILLSLCLKIHPHGMDCSHFIDVWFNDGRLSFFEPHEYAGKITPRDFFILSPILGKRIYTA